MRAFHTISLFLISLLLLGTGCSSNVSFSMPDESEAISLMTEYRVPTVGVSIIHDGKIEQTKLFGNLPHHSPAPENTLFNIASLTKPVTSTTVLILVSQGKWQLDEPLYHYWIDPDVAKDERYKKLTTRHVLTHRTGLPNWRGHEPGGILSFAFTPGTDWKYSGEGYEYLRQALERKFGIPFEKLVDSLLLTPLKMKATRFFWDDTVDTTLYANRYHVDGSPFALETWHEANPSNLVLTTVSDYAKFGIGVMDHKGFSSEIFQEMTATQVTLENNREWGLGWSIIRDLSNGEYALVHTGSNPGLHTIIILLPKTKRGIVIFTNGDNGDQVYKKLIGESLDLGREILDRMREV